MAENKSIQPFAPPAGRIQAAAIRPAGPGDLDAIDAVEGASFSADRFPRSNLRRLLARESAAALLAEERGRPLGYVLLLFRKGAKAARLYSIATAPEARGRGVGRMLLDAAARCAVERGCDRLRLEVRSSNVVATRAYVKAGFRAVKELPGYYADGETALLMEKRLELREAAAR